MVSIILFILNVNLDKLFAIQNIPIWFICAYIVLKEVYIEVKSFKGKKIEASKITASSMNQKRIQETLDNQTEILRNVSSYLQIIAKQYNENLTRSQAEIVLDMYYNSTCNNIIKFVAPVIKEISENLNDKEPKEIHLYKKINITERISRYFRNIKDSTSNILGKFKFVDKTLSIIISNEFFIELEDQIIELIFSTGEKDEDIVRFMKIHTETIRAIVEISNRYNSMSAASLQELNEDRRRRI